LEGVEAADVRVLVLDMQGRLMLDILGRGIEAALMNPSTLIAEPWQASSETLTGLGVDAMAVDPALVQTIQVLLSSDKPQSTLNRSAAFWYFGAASLLAHVNTKSVF